MFERKPKYWELRGKFWFIYKKQSRIQGKLVRRFFDPYYFPLQLLAFFEMKQSKFFYENMNLKEVYSDMTTFIIICFYVFKCSISIHLCIFYQFSTSWYGALYPCTYFNIYNSFSL